MKKLAVAVLAFILIFPLYACGYGELSTIKRYKDLDYEGIEKVTCTYGIQGSPRDVEVTGEKAQEVIELLKAVRFKKTTKKQVAGTTWSVTLHYSDDKTHTIAFIADLYAYYDEYYYTQNAVELGEKVREVIFEVYDSQGNSL